MRDCNIYAAKTKALISFAVTAKLICVFVLAYAKRWFSLDAAHLILWNKLLAGYMCMCVSVLIHTNLVTKCVDPEGFQWCC